jgi:hypothetical protein
MGGCLQLQACPICKKSGSFPLAQFMHKKEGRL